MSKRLSLLAALAAGAALGVFSTAAFGQVAGETFAPASNATSSHPGALTITRAKSGASIVEADITALAASKIHHASLAMRRGGKGLEDRQDEWLRPVLVYGLLGLAEEPLEGAKPLSLEGPWFASFDVTGAVGDAVSAKAKSIRFLVKELYRWVPESAELAVTYEGKSQKLPAQVSGVKAFHSGGSTFVTWDESEKLIDKADATIGEFQKARTELANRDKTRKLRYRILRHSAPITAKNAGQATAVAEVAALTCANIDGGMDHFARSGETQNRLVIENGKAPLPWGKGLYVHTTGEKEGTFHYAVVSVLNGAANLADFSDANAPADGLKEKSSPIPIPVLQSDRTGAKNEGVRSEARIRLYVTWNAEPFYNVPNVYSNWSVTIDEKQLARIAPVGLYLHEWAGTHMRTTWGWPGGRTGILVCGNDWPPQTWWYGFSDALGTLKSWGQSTVHNYTERRVLAFLDWVATQWAVDKNRVFAQGGSMGGAGAYTFALRNGDRFASVYGNVGIANWTVRGHFTTALELCTGYLNWKLPASDGVPVSDRMNMVKWLQDNPRVETPFLNCGNGKNDGAIGWEQARGFFLALQQTKRPHAAHWGMGGHGTGGVGMQLDDKRSQAFRLDQTLPAFAHCALDGDIGTAKKLEVPKEFKQYNEVLKDSYDGDSDGYFNAHLRWETGDADVIDQPNAWGLTVLLAKSCKSDSCTVDLTPRRCQRFAVKPAQKFKWTNTPVGPAAAGAPGSAPAATSSAPAGPTSGVVTADKDGLVTIEKVVVTKAGNRIRLELVE